MRSSDIRSVTYTQASENLASVFDAAVDDLEEIVITRKGHEPAVLVSLREYESIKETAYLLGNAANAAHLRESLAELQAGRGVVRELVDLDGE